MLSSEIIDLMGKLAPERMADSWDNSGVQIGSRHKTVKKILISLDLEKNSVKRAIEEKCDMIITHHPFFFGEVKNILTDGTRGEIVRDIIKHDITVYSAHTNLDVSKEGMNKVLSEKLGLGEIKPIAISFKDELYKLAIYVPRENAESLRKSVGDIGAGKMGNYEHCSFSIEGRGRFKPLKGSNPHIGALDRIEEVKEEKIEFLVLKSELNRTIDVVIEAHPYEEVAYDIYKLENEGQSYGYGGVGRIENAEKLESFAMRVKQKLRCDKVKVYGDLDRDIVSVAFCGGSGASFIDKVSENVDVYITGDIKYHDAQKAKEQGLALIDAGHFGMEKHIIEHIADYLKGSVEENVEILTFEYDFSEHITL